MRSCPALLLVLAAGLGCRPAGVYPLEALPSPDTDPPDLRYTAQAELEGTPSEGWDLVLTLQFRAEAGARPLVDVSRALLRADGTRWLPCKADRPDTDLVVHVEDGSRASLTVRCAHVQRPDQRLEVRIPVTGAGGRGVIEPSFEGLANSAPDDW